MCRVMLEKGAPGDSSDPFNTMVDVSPGDVTVTCTPNTCADALGDLVTVRVDGHFHLLTPILAPFTGGQDITLSESVTAQIAVEPVVGTATPSPTPTPVPTATPIPTPTPTPSPTAGPDGHAVPDTDRDPVPAAERALHGEPLLGQEEAAALPVHRPLDHDRRAARSPGPGTSGTGRGPRRPPRSRTRATSTTRRGTYTVQLVASNSGGSDTDSASVRVDP